MRPSPPGETWTAAIETALRRAEPLPHGLTPPAGFTTVGPEVVRRCRSMFTALRERLSDGGVIAVVSPHRGDGRSTVAAALAVFISRSAEGRVLLVDLDLDRPSQATRFGIGAPATLSGCIPDPEAPSVVPVGPDLWLLASGRGSVEETPASLGALAESRVADGCRAAFRWTVIDLPPILDIPEVTRVTAWADGFVMVGRYRTTRVDAIAAASRLLPPAPVAFVMTSHSSPVPHWVDRLL
jgi:Mrp family chromosome partitioning ATPase